jgi:regulator of RNase E activity RraA
MVGRARTAAFMEVYSVPPGDNPYELEIALIDSLQADEIPVFACSNPLRVAPWGELLSTAAKVRGAAGALMDGCVRDIKAIRAMRFPVFHGGIAPLDSKGRAKIIAIDVPIECAGVSVQSGDLVFGDADGVVVIPRRA